MRLIAAVVLIAGSLLLPACGGEDPAEEQRTPAAQADSAATKQPPKAKRQPPKAKRQPPKAKRRAGTTIRTGASEFGRMLFDAGKQAIYVFENDRKGRSVCYGECAEAWPPVFTDGKPVAGQGVRAGLLGTIKRRDGKLQVTYAGRPLYYYAHEDPGEVLCHNVNLNGGLWWVVGPDGNRRP